jgi:hypothetical protein
VVAINLALGPCAITVAAWALWTVGAFWALKGPVDAIRDARFQLSLHLCGTFLGHLTVDNSLVNPSFGVGHCFRNESIYTLTVRFDQFGECRAVTDSFADFLAGHPCVSLGKFAEGSEALTTFATLSTKTATALTIATWCFN